MSLPLKNRRKTVVTELCDLTQMVKVSEAGEVENAAALTLILGPQQWIGRVWSLTKDVAFGRDQDKADVYVPERSLSRAHFQLQIEGKKVRVKDLGSTNGTFVNKIKLKSNEYYELSNNDLLKSGRLIFRFIESGNIEAISALKVQEQVYTDPLCQTSNRKFIEDKMGEIINHCQKKHLFLSFIVLDIDHFKKINDTHTHLGGDFILSCLAARVKEIIRKEDIFARIGGEEFVLVTSTPMEGSIHFADKIRTSIYDEPFEFQDQKIQVSVSLGVTSLQDEDVDWKDLYKRADQALYQSKQSGRNKVTIL